MPSWQCLGLNALLFITISSVFSLRIALMQIMSFPDTFAVILVHQHAGCKVLGGNRGKGSPLRYKHIQGMGF